MSTQPTVVAVSLLTLVGLIPGVFALDGDLDVTFGNGGKVTTIVGPPIQGGARGIAIQADGRIVVIGSAHVGSLSFSDFAVVRYNPDGTQDASFGNDGIVTTDISTYDDAFDVAIQPDGKIVVVGSAGGLSSATVRYNVDGTLDASFDGDGIVTTSGSINTFAFDVAIQPDGKIVVVGMTRNADEDFLIIRYNADGTLDTTFDGDGIATTDVGAGDDQAHGIALQGDGKIVVAGIAVRGSWYAFAVVRYLSDGSMDSAFNGDGKAFADLGNTDDYARAVAIQPDGKIVIVGESDSNLPSLHAEFGVARFGPDGELDTTFNGSGKVRTVLEPNSGCEANDILVQDDGKLLALGRHHDNATGRDRFAAVRYNADGSQDTSFGTGGFVTTTFGQTAVAYGGALQTDGKIVAGGPSDGAFAVARYLNGQPAEPTPCTVAPRTECRAAGASRLLLSSSPDERRNKLVWKWLRGAETTLDELGVPTGTTNYTLCVYAGTSAASIALPGGSSWAPIGTKGFKFKDAAGSPDGAVKALLKSGANGRAKVLVKAKGSNLPDTLAPMLTMPVIVQLANDSNEICFEATYTTATRNDSTRFKAKTP